MKKGFTLIELLLVIACIGMIAAIIQLQMSDFKNKGKEVRLANDLRNSQIIVDMFQSETGHYPTNDQPVLTNEPIDWNALVPDYSKNNPILDEGQQFYVQPDGKVVMNYDTNASFLKWLKYSKMIVENSSDSDYEGIEPPIGTVFLNYNVDTQKFSNYAGASQSLTLSTASVGDSLLEAYVTTKDPIFLNRAKLVGQRLSSQMFSTNYYGDSSKTLHLLPGLSSFNGTNWADDRGESPINANALTAKFLIRLGQVSNEPIFSENGKKLLDTLVFIQSEIEINKPTIAGAFPYAFVRNSESNYGVTWTKFPLDVAYMIVDASDWGVNSFKENKYANMKNKFINFTERMINDPVIKGKSSAGFPYEYIVFTGDDTTEKYEGQNENQLNANIFSNSEPFTTDQFFYIALGLSRANSPLGKEMFDLAKNKLITDNNFFWGQYNVDGSKDNHSEVHFETVNSAFYIELLKKYENQNTKSFSISLFDKMFKNNDDPNSNMGVTWAPGEEYIESLASGFMAQKILEDIR